MAMEHGELNCWRICYDEPLTIGVMVEATDECKAPDFIGHGQTFMITSLCFDSEGVNIGLNDDGKPDDFETAYDGFRIDELRPVKNADHTS
ncbi:TPA: hypothetical protein ACPVYZ_004311 [Vibrio parahaemolyticus]|nr:hypothetical protein [Vibrio parahaemolyticus]